MGVSRGRVRIPLNKFSFCPSDSFEQDSGLTGLSLLGAVVHFFGVVGARASQVQEAEAGFQAEGLLGAGCGAVVVVCGGSVVQIPLCTLCPVTCREGEGQ